MNYNQSILRMMEIISKKFIEIDKTGLSGISQIHSHGLSDLLVMLELKNTGKMTTQDLHKSFSVDRGIINTIVARLMTQGYVKKERDAADKRKAYLSLTDSGEQCYEMLKELEQTALDFVMKDFSINEQKAVLKFLSRVNQLTVEKYEENEENEEQTL